MGGFRKAMPFTFVTFTIGALALSGFPLLSGFFSKDEILAFTLNRGGGFVILGLAGYLAAGLTAFYAFRMVFRVFFGEPVPEARELEEGHVAHAEPANPLTGEAEDNDVGFPGPEHHFAEESFPMKFAMAPLALLAIIGGFVGVPGLTDTLEKFLEPTFEDSRFANTHPTDSAEWVGLGGGAIVGIAGIAVAYVMFIRRRGHDPATRGAFRRGPQLPHAQVVLRRALRRRVRPAAGSTAGSFGRRVIETEFVQGFIVGGATGVVRAGTSLARAAQTGFLRAYALLLLFGAAALLLYFLIASA